MVPETIYLKDVLSQMKTLDDDGRAVPFSIKVRTMQRFSKTGGQLRSWARAKLVIKEENPNSDSVLALRTKSKPRSSMRKNPNHFANKTRNIKILPSGKIKKINILFIIEFNGKKVIY